MKVTRNNWWLYEQIRTIKGVKIHSGDLLLKVSFSGKSLSIYVPDSSEYMITEDCVGKVLEFGGNLISYASGWSRGPSSEAQSLARANGVNIWPHGKTLSCFKGEKTSD